MKIKLNETQKAAYTLSSISEVQKGMFFYYVAQEIKKNRIKLGKANQKDIRIAKHKKLIEPFIQRMTFGNKEIDELLQRINAISKSQRCVGVLRDEKKLKNGLKLQKISTPLGVIFVIYESRPEVTIDVACICVKSSNAVILKSGSDIKNTNKILFSCISTALRKSKLPRHAVFAIQNTKWKEWYTLLKEKKSIDLVVARGGYAMVRSIQRKSKIPVLAHSSGGARIYVDKSADLKRSIEIILNSKISKPSACNALDTILLHRKIAKSFLPLLTKELHQHGVKLITHVDWNKEILGMSVGVKMVRNELEAIEFIKKYSKGHTEGIISSDRAIIDYFIKSIDAASLMINCSTRLHDGSVYELGAEMGISTGKLHARGPVGPMDLTTYKWVVYGNGQTRE